MKVILIMEKKLIVCLKKVKNKDNMEKVMANHIAQEFLYFYQELMLKLMI